jgi:hypothetical protein
MSLITYRALDQVHAGGPYLLDWKGGTLVRLGAGRRPMMISGDNRWVLVVDDSPRSRSKDVALSVIPVEGGGECRIDTRGVGLLATYPGFFPGTRRVLLTDDLGRRWIASPDQAPVRVSEPPGEVVLSDPLGPDTIWALMKTDRVLVCTVGRWDWHETASLGKDNGLLSWEPSLGKLLLARKAVTAASRWGWDGRPKAELPDPVPLWTLDPGDGRLEPAPPLPEPLRKAMMSPLATELRLAPGKGGIVRRSEKGRLYFLDGAFGPP